jgi:OprF membrane domain
MQRSMRMKNSRLRRIPTLTLSLLAMATSLFAQDHRVEVNPFFGYTLSDGVTVDTFVVGGVPYDSINPKSGTSYGIQFGVFVTENIEVGFLWDRQNSKLEAKDGTARDFTDMTNSNYHGIFTYNFGYEDSAVRPFAFGGLGATTFAPSDIGGQAIDSLTKFSTTWGGGVKVYPSPSFGITAMARWTPNYIKSDPAGIWCSPYWFYGCYVVGDAQYANQFEMSGGVSLRF